MMHGKLAVCLTAGPANGAPTKQSILLRAGDDVYSYAQLISAQVCFALLGARRVLIVLPQFNVAYPKMVA